MMAGDLEQHEQQVRAVTVRGVFDLPLLRPGAALDPEGWVAGLAKIRIKPEWLADNRSPAWARVKAWRHVDAPGLCYHRTYGTNPRVISYSITHLGSGLRCAPVTLSHAEARAVLAEIAHGLDWTQTEEAIKRDDAAYRARHTEVAFRYCDSEPPLLRGMDW